MSHKNAIFSEWEDSPVLSHRGLWAPGRAELKVTAAVTPPQLAQWDMGKWDWAEKHRSSTTTKYIWIFVCVYTLYGYLYKLSVYTGQIKSRVSLHYTISESPELNDPQEDPVLPYTLSIWPSDIYLKTKARAGTLSQGFVSLSCDGGHSLLPYG